MKRSSTTRDESFLKSSSNSTVMLVCLLAALLFLCLGASGLARGPRGEISTDASSRDAVPRWAKIEAATNPAVSISFAATTWYVNPSPAGNGMACTQFAPCATIAQAITNAAPSGDTIEVAAGTYLEHDLIVSKSLS